MYARDLEHAADYLAARRRRAREAAVLAIAALAGAASAVAFSGALAVALAAGAVVEVLIGAATWLARRELIARLALDPGAYVLREVAMYGASVTRRRERLASWIAEIVTEPPRANTLYLGERVSRYADELLALARDLGAPRVTVRPASVVACQRLLTHAVDSPLYNPRLPPDELPRTLARIRTGIARS
ncbi:MAG: hypothetical protein M3188_00685 [Actinomycetota bacterium]|nr:hypothetical protein [Actinomycetota bacterium]